MGSVEPATAGSLPVHRETPGSRELWALANEMPWLEENPDDFCVLDTETVGFFGPIVLLQWGLGLAGEIHLDSIMKLPIRRTLAFLEWLATQRVLGFNLAFDVFKVQQAYTTLLLLAEQVGADALPEDHVDAYAMCEPDARDGPCWKPRSAMDLMLHARKGPYQNLMARDPIIIRRVPSAIAKLVASELEKRVSIPDIFFAKKKNKKEAKWKIRDLPNTTDFVNIELVFAPSSALKALATHELGLENTLLYGDIEIDRKLLPVENGFAPFALSVGSPADWKGSWPDVIKAHSSHWAYNRLAREYAANDVTYPRGLWVKWGTPEFGDDDSLLACLAGSARWKGYAANLKGIKALRKKALKKMDSAPRAPKQVMAWLKEALSEVEQVVLTDKKTGALTTKRVVLEEIAKQRTDELCRSCASQNRCSRCKGLVADCAICGGVNKCSRCGGTGTELTEAGSRARQVLAARKAKKEAETYDKILLAGRFHVSVNVIGTRSSRQSGGQVSEGKKGRKSGGLNPQGIQKKKLIRAQFTLAFTKGIQKAYGIRKAVERWARICDWPEDVLDEVLRGGDFDAFEVNIAAAYYDDPQLVADLKAVEPDCHHNECGGKCPKCKGIVAKPGSCKIHAIVGTLVYPHGCGDDEVCEKTRPKCPKPRTYWDIKLTDGKDDDKYTKSKSGFFALIYFGTDKTLEDRLGIPPGAGLPAYNSIMAHFPVMGAKRLEFYSRFCPLRQPGGIGSKVTWTDPEEFVTSMLGFKRFFTLENQVIKAIYDLAEDVPPEWRDIKIRVMRRERLQTVAGATQSALFAAAFGLQGANMRAAGNHVVQATGAGLTKILQARIWKLQPCGIGPWLVRPMNVHDELPTSCVPKVVDRVAEIQREFVAEYKKLIPLLGMKWRVMANWAGK